MPVAEGYASLVGSCRRLQCCDPTVEERRYGKSIRHVLETGGGTTASGDPVPVARVPRPTHRGTAQFTTKISLVLSA